MSASGRAVEFMRAWGDGHAQPHDPGCQRWGADPCDRCTFEAFPDPWDALMEAARIAGLSEPSGPEPATSDEPSEHQLEHENYGTWPCAWNGSLECPIVAELARRDRTLEAHRATSDEPAEAKAGYERPTRVGESQRERPEQMPRAAHSHERPLRVGPEPQREALAEADRRPAVLRPGRLDGRGGMATDANGATKHGRSALTAEHRAASDEPARWAVDLIDCGRDDGVQVCASWAEADAFRQSYVAAADGMQHCERNAIIRRAMPDARLGYHDRAPNFSPGPAASGTPEANR